MIADSLSNSSKTCSFIALWFMHIHATWEHGHIIYRYYNNFMQLLWVSKIVWEYASQNLKSLTDAPLLATYQQHHNKCMYYKICCHHWVCQDTFWDCHPQCDTRHAVLVKPLLWCFHNTGHTLHLLGDVKCKTWKYITIYHSWLNQMHYAVCCSYASATIISLHIPVCICKGQNMFMMTLSAVTQHSVFMYRYMAFDAFVCFSQIHHPVAQ